MNRKSMVATSLLLAMSSLSFLGWAGIEGSKHDFSSEEWTGGDMCAACHVPHRSVAPTEGPLWDPEADLNETFGTAVGENANPQRGTMMCVRCHDGTVAGDTIGGVSGNSFANHQHDGIFALGHGTTDHPVGIAYPNVDNGYRPAGVLQSEGVIKLPAGNVECVSCHDPHNTSGAPYMLVMSNERSALCLSCHRK